MYCVERRGEREKRGCDGIETELNWMESFKMCLKSATDELKRKRFSATWEVDGAVEKKEKEMREHF